MPLSEYQRQRIISLWTGGGVTKGEIRRTLAREGVITTHHTITNTITRWQTTGSVQDRPQIGQVKAIPETHYRFIDAAMAENDELTASDLKVMLAKEFGEEKATYSERTVARARIASTILQYTVKVWTKNTPTSVATMKSAGSVCATRFHPTHENVIAYGGSGE